jgi:hypothetical protein
MKSYAVATWGKWLEAQAREETSADACAGRSQIIEVGTEAVGLLRVDRFPTCLQLEQLFVLPEH